jgi:hypothetical protein
MSAPTGSAARPLFSAAMGMALVLVGAFSFLAYFVLSAYAPEQNEDDGRATAVSRSAVGFAGLAALLRAQGIPVIVSRGLRPEDAKRASLVILTPELSNDPDEFRETTPALIILPKWIVVPDPEHRGWVSKAGTLPAEEIAKQLLQPLAPDSFVKRGTGVLRRVQLDIRTGSTAIGPLDSPQTVSGKAWAPYITDGAGGALFAKQRDADRYVLADPDLMNTHGLASLANARLATELIQLMRSGNGPVVLDATLNGFRRSPNLLRLAFEPPLLGVTLCALLVAALMGMHAAQSFGSPRAPGRVFAFGKQTLADNSARLIVLAKREHRMAPSYATATRDAVARALGVRAEADGALDRALEQRAKRNSGTQSFSALLKEAAAAENREYLMRVARKLYRWRQEMMHAGR